MERSTAEAAARGKPKRALIYVVASILLFALAVALGGVGLELILGDALAPLMNEGVRAVIERQGG